MTTLAAAPITCYVEPDRIHRGRKSLSLCGTWVDPEDISDTPTCPACQRRRLMDPVVSLLVRLSMREVAALRAALRHVQHEPAGLSDLARLELEGGAWLTDAELDDLVARLS